MSKLVERIGRSINELDIDFSRFTLVGWGVSLASLTLGFIAGLAAYRSVVGRIEEDRGPALVFGFTMIGTTVVLFLVLRAFVTKLDLPIVRDPPAEDCGQRE